MKKSKNWRQTGQKSAQHNDNTFNWKSTEYTTQHEEIDHKNAGSSGTLRASLIYQSLCMFVDDLILLLSWSIV